MKTQVILSRVSCRLPRVALLLGGVGCDDGTAPAALTGGTAPLYLVATAITTVEGSTTYVKTVPSLSGTGGALSFDEAREFPGWADGAGHRRHVIDGVTHLLTPQANAAGPKGTTYYALSPDGTTTRGLELGGWSTRAVRMR